MTILRIVSRGVDRKTYEAMRSMLDIDRNHPLGLIMHGVSERTGEFTLRRSGTHMSTRDASTRNFSRP